MVEMVEQHDEGRPGQGGHQELEEVRRRLRTLAEQRLRRGLDQTAQDEYQRLALREVELLRSLPWRPDPRSEADELLDEVRRRRRRLERSRDHFGVSEWHEREYLDLTRAEARVLKMLEND